MLVLRRVIRRIRARFARVDILVGGGNHLRRLEALGWCERNWAGYVFGVSGNSL